MAPARNIARSRLRWERPRGWLMLLAVVIAGLCTLAAQGEADSRRPAGGTQLVAIEGLVRPLFVLPSLSGSVQELGRFRGKVVLVHFFATWCEPCRDEMASLEQLQSRLDRRPFAIVCISVAETNGAVRRFFAGDPPFAILLDHDRSVARAWNIQTLPSTIVLDLGLKPRFMAEGDVDWARPEVMNMLMQLLVKASPG
jgi:thiol-disulfide isomerase/thioredoxin